MQSEHPTASRPYRHMDKKRIEEIISAFKGKRIAIIGDIMLDKYIFGHVSRISPEYPVPVVDVPMKTIDLGELRMLLLTPSHSELKQSFSALRATTATAQRCLNSSKHTASPARDSFPTHQDRQPAKHEYSPRITISHGWILKKGTILMTAPCSRFLTH